MKNININDIYQYVFGNRVNNTGAKQPNPTTHPAANSQKKIQEKLNELINGENASSFRALLRKLGKSELEQVLYNNTTEDFDTSFISFPDDENIKNIFDKLNKTHGFFIDEKDKQLARENFVILFKGCKLIADYIEKNNTIDDDVAFQHAYKMLVLFGTSQDEKNPFAPFQTYINRQLHSARKPVHDALVMPLPTNQSINLKIWRKFIAKHGYKALCAFQMAEEIQKELKCDPKSFEEVEQTINKLTYPLADQNLELAKMCSDYKLSEAIFNKCLATEKNRKKRDNLPEALIDGSKLHHPGYYLTKLPIDDLKAYVLGHIVDDCQSMGGHSQQCVIDGVTLENNGFYVLLKQKNPTKNAKPLLENGKINYKDFNIVGQAYAYFTKFDNFTFDSWENLRPAEDDKVIHPLLTQFAEELVQNHPTIIRVTIGKGGRTPIIFNNDIANPEKIKEGFQYPDSDKQEQIAINSEKLNELHKKLSETAIKLQYLGLFKHLGILTLENMLTSNAPHWLNYPNSLETFFLDPNKQLLWDKLQGINQGTLENIFTLIINHGEQFNQLLIGPNAVEFDVTRFRMLLNRKDFAIIWQTIALLKDKHIASATNIAILLDTKNRTRDTKTTKSHYDQILDQLNKLNLLTDENFKLISSAIKDEIHSSELFCNYPLFKLLRTNIPWTNEKLKIFLENVQKFPELIQIISDLYACNVKVEFLFEKENLTKDNIAIYKTILKDRDCKIQLERSGVKADSVFKQLLEKVQQQPLKMQEFIVETRNFFENAEVKHPAAEKVMKNFIEYYHNNKYTEFELSTLICNWKKDYESKYEHTNPFAILFSYVTSSYDGSKINDKPFLIDLFAKLVPDDYIESIIDIQSSWVAESYKCNAKVIGELLALRDKRLKEANFNKKNNTYKLTHKNTFFGRFNAQTKITTIEKLISAIQGEKVTFSNIELAAMKDSRLGKICAKYMDDSHCNLTMLAKPK